MLLELVRQARRRRTLVSLAAVVLLPVIVVVAIAVNGGPGNGNGSADFIDIASRSGLNAAFFVLVATSQFLLVVIVALFAGDSIASEAQWGSLRYLLVRPIGRARLLRVKLSAAALYGIGAAVLLPLVGAIAGTIAFGWHPVTTPVGGGFSAAEGVWRLVLSDGYVMAMMGCVVGLAFLFSTMTDAPLGAVGGAVVLVVISQVLDQVTALGVVRTWLPTHYWFSWTELLQTPMVTDQVARGLISAVPWTIVPILLAFLRFRRKDILS
ncbi:MAG: transporter permease [Mycobacterium sp.]|jgi:ABC-2 type transport system permease protein|nr:transporter permease [Mycobacterium sp.]